MAKKSTTTKSTPGFDAPQSRNEAILQNILGADNVLDEPQSRIEALLMQILEQGGGGGAVDSVNGQTGTVVLDADDVGATPETFLVTISKSNDAFVADKTYPEIVAAYEAGKRLMFYYPPGANASPQIYAEPIVTKQPISGNTHIFTAELFDPSVSSGVPISLTCYGCQIIGNNNTSAISVYSGPVVRLSSDPPFGLSSTASAGFSRTVSRADHQHPFPTASEVGAIGINDDATNVLAIIVATGTDGGPVEGDTVVLNSGLSDLTAFSLRAVKLNIVFVIPLTSNPQTISDFKILTWGSIVTPDFTTRKVEITGVGGNYIFTASLTDTGNDQMVGNLHITRVQPHYQTGTLTIATTDWVNGSCTKTVTGMTEDALGFVKYSDTETEFTETQGANSMTFTASTTPSEAVTVEVAWFKEAMST